MKFLFVEETAVSPFASMPMYPQGMRRMWPDTVGVCVCEYLYQTLAHGLLEDFLRRRYDNHSNPFFHLSTLHQLRCNPQVFYAAVGTGSEVCLVYLDV